MVEAERKLAHGIGEQRTVELAINPGAAIEERQEETRSGLTRLEFNLTEKCNAKCPYCANDVGLKERARDQVLTIEKIEELIDEVGPKIVNFTGGEPTIEKELLRKAIRAASQRGCIVQLDTHALFLTEEEIDEFVADGVNRFHISYSTTRESFAKFRGVDARHFDTLERNIRHISSLPTVQCLCECILHTGNFEELGAIYQRSRELGIDEFQIQPLMPAGKADMTMVLPPDRLAQGLRDIFRDEQPDTPIKVWCSYVTQCSEDAGGLYAPRERLRAPKLVAPKEITGMDAGCQEGWSRLHIHNNGDVLICSITKLVGPLGNVYEDDILDIYENHPLLQQLRGTKPKECAPCQEWDKCHNACQILALDVDEVNPPRFSGWIAQNLK